MKDLVGRLSALDPEASEALKVVAFFDALIANGAGVDSLLRGAAVLAGVTAGAERKGAIVRFDPAGQRVQGDAIPARSGERSLSSGTVWLEREGPAFANDAMILERLAFAVGLIETRLTGVGGLSVVVDPSRSVEERAAALPRLRLDPSSRVRIIATEAAGTRVGYATSMIPTRYGLIQATLDIDGSFDPPLPAGLGPWVRADHAPQSWEGAIIALRLATRLTPVVDASTLGALLLLVRAYDPEAPHEDVVALRRLDGSSADVLRVLVESESIRSAAAELGMHHSTLHAKYDSLTRTLGYDPRSTIGRTRYILAEVLRRVSEGV